MSRVRGCWILNAQKFARATKHLSTPVSFIYGFECASAGSSRAGDCLSRIFLLFFLNSCDRFLERELMELSCLLLTASSEILKSEKIFTAK